MSGVVRLSGVLEPYGIGQFVSPRRSGRNELYTARRAASRCALLIRDLVIRGPDRASILRGSGLRVP